MTSERECFVYIVLSGATEFVAAGRFRWIDEGAAAVGQFVYGRSYRVRADAVEVDPIELRLSTQVYETARMQGRWNHSRVAHGMLALARTCGLNVADSRIATALGVAMYCSFGGSTVTGWMPAIAATGWSAP